MNPLRIPRTRTRRALPILFLSLLSANALAQAPTGVAGAELALWPASLGAGGHFESIELLDMNNDGSMDAVVQDAGYIVFLDWLEVFMASSVVQTPNGQDLIVNDFALVDAPGDLGGHGAIATVGFAGLEIYQWDPKADRFLSTAHVTKDWLGASEVHAADWNGDGYIDLVGLDDTRMGVHVMLGTASLSTWNTGPSFTLPAPAVEIEPIRWTGSTNLELAVTDAFGLYVYDTNGLPIYVRQSPLAPGMLAVIQNGSSPSNITWLLGPLGGDTHVLSTLSEAKGAFDVRVMNQGFPLTLATGDYNGDGASDLGMTFSDSHKTLILTSALGAFSGGVETILGSDPYMSIVGTTNGAPVAFSDVNQNGTVDVVLASQPAGGIVLLHQDTLEVSCCPSGSDGFTPNTASYCLNGTDAYMTIDYSCSTDPSVVDFELTTWRQSSPTEYVSEVAISVCQASFGLANGTGTGTVETTIPGQDFLTSDSIIYFVLRPLDINGRQAAPAIVLGFSTNSQNLNIFEAADAWNAIEYPYAGLCSQSGGTYPGGAQGGIKGSKRIPRFPPGSRPDKTADCDTPTQGTTGG